MDESTRQIQFISAMISKTRTLFLFFHHAFKIRWFGGRWSHQSGSSSTNACGCWSKRFSLSKIAHLGELTHFGEEQHVWPLEALWRARFVWHARVSGQEQLTSSSNDRGFSTLSGQKTNYETTILHWAPELASSSRDGQRRGSKRACEFSPVPEFFGKTWAFQWKAPNEIQFRWDLSRTSTRWCCSISLNKTGVVKTQTIIWTSLRSASRGLLLLESSGRYSVYDLVKHGSVGLIDVGECVNEFVFGKGRNCFNQMFQYILNDNSALKSTRRMHQIVSTMVSGSLDESMNSQFLEFVKSFTNSENDGSISQFNSAINFGILLADIFHPVDELDSDINVERYSPCLAHVLKYIHRLQKSSLIANQ